MIRPCNMCVFFIFVCLFIYFFAQVYFRFEKKLTIKLFLILSKSNILIRNVSKSDNTSIIKYFYSFIKWKKWATKNNVQVFPVNSLHLTLYLTFLVQNGCGKSVITDAFYGFRWAHTLVGIISPTDSLIVKMF